MTIYNIAYNRVQEGEERGINTLHLETKKGSSDISEKNPLISPKILGPRVNESASRLRIDWKVLVQDFWL